MIGALPLQRTGSGTIMHRLFYTNMKYKSTPCNGLETCEGWELGLAPPTPHNSELHGRMEMGMLWVLRETCLSYLLYGHNASNLQGKC